MEVGWIVRIWMEFGWNLDEMQDETGSVLDGTLDGIYDNVLYFGMRCLKNNMIIVIIRLRVDNYLETLYIIIKLETFSTFNLLRLGHSITVDRSSSPTARFPQAVNERI